MDPFADPDSPGPVFYAPNLTSFPLEPGDTPTVTADEALSIQSAGMVLWRMAEPRITLRRVSVGFEGQDATFPPRISAG